MRAAVSPRKHPPVRFRGLAGRGIAPAARRLAGCCTPVRSSVAGRRRLWPQANRRRRGGQGGMAPCGFFPPFLVRTRNGAARRGGTRQLRRSMSGKPKGSLSVDYRQAPPLTERQIETRRRSATDNLRRSPSGKPKKAPCRRAADKLRRSLSGTSEAPRRGAKSSERKLNKKEASQQAPKERTRKYPR